jgi:hypothetical protein
VNANSMSVVNSNMMKGKGGCVALQVVPVRIRGENNKTVTTLALLDACSQETFIRKTLVEKLNIHVTGYESLAVTTMAGESVIQAGHVNFTVEAVRNPQRRVRVQGVSVENLNVTSAHPGDLNRWEHLKGIEIPDVDINEVTLLIGANTPAAQVHMESRIGRSGEPFAVRTILGWCVIGPTRTDEGGTKERRSVNFLSSVQNDMDNQISRFLELDSIGVGEVPGMSVEDRKAMKILEESTKLVDGKFEVGMLWRHENPWLPDNRSTAEARLNSLKRKLVKDPKLHEKYTEFMNKLIDKEYARKLTPEEAQTHTDKTWYLPHHSVVNPRKPEKVRVVFDAAATHQNVSLNDQLMQGPDLISSLLGILLRFRERPIAIVGDIEAMFLQVRVPDEDTEALRFLWWTDGQLDGPVDEYKMVRHIFGARDSPACCNFALKETAKNCRGFSQEAREAVLKSFYVDDMVGSVDTVDIGISRIQDVSAIVGDGGFHIRGWLSNSLEVMMSVPESVRAAAVVDLDFDKSPVNRTLGMEWNVKLDIFRFSVSLAEKPATKRGVLSTLSSLFDPMGFICPIILTAKNIMQHLWSLKIDWDEDIPPAEQRVWEEWKADLSALATVSIPRCHLSQATENLLEASLHSFSDGSTVGYGMCSYLRFIYKDGTIQCSLLIGRARCAPVRTTSIPRLELQAARLAVRIYQTIQEELTYSISSVWFWTDAQTVLNYISNESKRFNVYVANRVAEIRAVTTPDQWRHCPGVENPADDASRGLSSRDLSLQHRWLRGPEFLWKTEDCWPPNQAVVTELAENDPEVKRHVNVHVLTSVEENVAMQLIDRSQSWKELVRQAALVMRLGQIYANEDESSLVAVKEAKEWILKAVQRQYFPEEMARLQDGGPVKTGSRIRNLKPVLVNGILRVGGRLDNAPTLSSDEKYPVILPKNHKISQLVMRDAHQRLAHAGREQTLAETRKEFWILGGRNLSKRTIGNCIDCRRENARPMHQIMAALPEFRLVPFQPAFTTTGCDLFGPLAVKWGRNSTVKRWGCLFTCLVTRAVYLETVQSLSTDDFILTLRQFTSRRGPPEDIRCDNGSNFTGADRELTRAIEEWNQQLIVTEMQQRGIRFTFQPPNAPHMAGVWERLVKTSKRHLRALSGGILLTDNGLRTLLAEAEAIMNGRPLCPVSEDPKDYESLTPNHFLMQRKLVGLPPGIFAKEDGLLRKEWRKVQWATELFWQRWVREYLPSLQKLDKWRTTQRDVRVGDLVLLVEDGVKRGQWPLGRVTKLVSGKDNHVRSAFVKTETAEYHRPIVKMCLLEAAEDRSNDESSEEQ